ncbi:MAG: hypothetical protein LUG13_03710 [Oscillospiraceae bacterium]|nr:hypothetical protein [Oscillospiraceae bacterium]
MKKMYLAMTHDEWRIVIASLNAHRNMRIAEGRNIDFADEVLFKVMTAPVRKVRIS